MPANIPLTQHLRTLATSQSYVNATKHEFLTAIGRGTAPKDLLALWLSQNRIYAAQAYPRFVGRLIARVPFSSDDSIVSEQEKKNQEILRILVFSLQNVVREANFFLETAKRFGFDLDVWAERKETKVYTSAMMKYASESSLEEGLVFLWAMEKVYLDAWTFFGEELKSSNFSPSSSKIDSDVRIPASEFVQNWTNAGFVEFVNEVAKLVDSLHITPDSALWKKSEVVWNTVVDLEIGFWPRLGEDSEAEALRHK